MKPPCIVFEDEHLLVVNKPASLNTHSPGPFAGQGLYEWLRDREPRWARLAIVHRLDKETSGIILFSKTPLANRSLTDQFTKREVRKKYMFLTNGAVPEAMLSIKTALVRVGDTYVSRPIAAGAQVAETQFKLVKYASQAGLERCAVVEARPLTGRTHQIRVHAAEKKFPILGDLKYGGTPAPRLCLHASEISFQHPASGEELSFEAPVDFSMAPGRELRNALITPETTSAYRLIHGQSDCWPGWYVERLGDFILSQSAGPLSNEQDSRLTSLIRELSARGAYHKRLAVRPQAADRLDASPQHTAGAEAPSYFHVLENGLRFELSLVEGYSFGLFLDQRDNRRRLLTGYIAPEFPLLDTRVKHQTPRLLNAFCYTCGFSVCAAKAGWQTTSLDLSKKYLEWGKRNFGLNQINPDDHEFIFGDVFDWLRRLQKKGRSFEAILLDPPAFSQSKQSGPFRAEKDYGKLVSAALPLLQPGAVLFASCNLASWAPEAFLEAIKAAIRAAGRTIVQEHYVPQPPDFPISRNEPAYLKTIWLRLQ